jgi:hypothetical protein
MEINLKQNLIAWLNEHGLDALKERDIRVTTDYRFPGLYNLKYGIFANKTDPITCACRGAVVQKDEDGFKLVAYAFDRFFNLGEFGAADIDWETATVYEKYDGSLIKLFWSGTQWVVSTSGSVGGAGDVEGYDITFEELFWDTWRYMRYRIFDLEPHLCYIFELCTPQNRIVVNYKEPMLRLLAVRDREDNFRELDLDVFRSKLWVAESFQPSHSSSSGTFNNGVHVEIEANTRGANHEGFIVCDANGNRIKVKSTLYVQLHLMINNGSPNFSELYLNGDLGEFLLYFPKYAAEFETHAISLETWAKLVDWVCTEFAELPQKEFAIKVLKVAPTVQGAAFGIRSGKFANFDEFIAQLTPKQLGRLLELD